MACFAELITSLVYSTTAKFLIKTGKQTPSLDRFLAGLYGKPVPGLVFFRLSLLSTKERRSFLIAVEQVLPTLKEHAAAHEARCQRRYSICRDPGPRMHAHPNHDPRAAHALPSSLNTAMIRIGEVFKEAVKRNASAPVMADNHLSHDCIPRPEDVLDTRAIVEAGNLLTISVLDHLIV